MSDLNTASGTIQSFASKGALLSAVECQDPVRSALAMIASQKAPVAGAPLSFSQQQVWLHAQLSPESPIYNEVLILEHKGPLDRDVLQQALGELTRRQWSLRTTFVVEDGSPVQMVAAAQNIELPVTDLSSLSQQEQEAETRRIATDAARESFDLARGPLLRVRLVACSHEHHLLIIAVHTVVADQRSLQILAEELGILYSASAGTQPLPLPDLPVQYVDYSRWQRERFQGDAAEKGISYWRETLAGIPAVLELATDRPRPPVQDFAGGQRTQVLSRDLVGSLKELSEALGTELPLTLLAGFQALLARYTRQDDIVVGWIVSGREQADADRVIGLFENAISVRTDLGEDPSFRDLLLKMKHTASAARQHQNVPFEEIVSAVQPDRDPSRNPIFQALFSMDAPIFQAASSWQVANQQISSGTAKVDLQLQLREEADGTITANFIYRIDLFDTATIARMGGHFERLLRGAVNNPNQRISRLPLITDAERNQLIVEWNNTQADYPNRCLHQLFEAQASRTPEATAVVFEHQQLTYRELNRRANQLARHLIKLGVGPDVLVGISVERSLEMMVGLLGILKAGGAYVPADPAFPADRVSFMLEDAEVPVLLTQQALVDSLPKSKARVICLDTGWGEVAKESDENPTADVKPADLAYVLYTSGSTGKPKGVQIPHCAVSNFLTSMRREPGMTERDRMFAVTTLSFDIAGLELYLPLLVGGSVEIVSRSVYSDGDQLLARLNSAGATVMQATPATWRMLLEAGWQGNPGLKILCGGEAVSQKLVDQLLPKASSVWNMYGPTETTIWSTTCKFESGRPTVSIGRPIANTQIFILDKILQPVPVGVAGELHIGGEGLARGYLKRPELTEEKFIADPFSTQPNARLYKTGDLVRYLPNGDIEFLGRIDYQLKIRGFRVELGEIEAVLRQHPAVNETVVVAREDNPGDKRIIAYFVPVPAQAAAPSSQELRDFLKQRLPEYMLPSAFVSLMTLPLTPNGKVNRRALPAPDQSNLAPRRELAQPKNAAEATLVGIWESILATQPIGVNHDFFELGGHSLLAVRLMHRIEQVFGKKLPVAVLFQARTIEQLAVIVQQSGWQPAWASLVPVQVGGSKAPFFCVHGAGGVVIRFYDLARHLGPDQPVYGLQARGLDSRYSCDRRVEDMATHYLSEIRQVQPRGPYLLGGYSLGGMVALEMGQRLLEEGEKQVLVVLFDTFCPRQAHEQVSLQDVAKAIRSSMHKFSRMSAVEKRVHVSRTARTLWQGVRRRTGHLRLPKALKQVRHACEQAASNYVPSVYQGRLLLFRSSHPPLAQFRDPHLGWGLYAAQGLQIHEIECDHDGILLEPQVQIVAEQLKKCLGQEEAANGSRFAT